MPTTRWWARCAGLGWFAGLELVRDKATRDPFASEQNIGLFIERRCQEHGVILRALGDTLTVAPPLIVDRETLAEVVRVVGVALDETLRHVKAEGWM